MKTTILALLLLGLAAAASAAVQGKDVTYGADDVPLQGYLAWDNDNQGKRPGVLVVHEWWGHNEHARERAEAVAELGYVGFALDMYGKGKVAEHPDTAGKFANAVKQNWELEKERFMAALELLRNDPRVDPEKVAAIGYCFGGGVVLDMARAGINLDAVASFHGSLGTNIPAEKGKVRARVIVFNGGADPLVKPEQIGAFTREMATAGVDFRFYNFAGVKHSFTNPKANDFAEKFNLPLAYDARVAAESWQEMQEFFTETFDRD